MRLRHTPDNLRYRMFWRMCIELQTKSNYGLQRTALAMRSYRVHQQYRPIRQGTRVALRHAGMPQH